MSVSQVSSNQVTPSANVVASSRTSRSHSKAGESHKHHERRSGECKEKSRHDDVNLSDEAKGKHCPGRGVKSDKSRHHGKHRDRHCEPGRDEHRDRHCGPGRDEHRDRHCGPGGLEQELDCIKDLLSGLKDCFKKKPKKGSCGGGGGCSGGGAPSGGGSCGGARPAPVCQPLMPMNSMSPMNAVNCGNPLDAQLLQLAAQIIMLASSGAGGGCHHHHCCPQEQAFGKLGCMPGGSGFGNSAGPGRMNVSFGSGQNQLGALSAKLKMAYQQAGGMQNQSIRPETHKLVQMALGSGLGGAAMGQQMPQQLGFGLNINFSASFGGGFSGGVSMGAVAAGGRFFA